MDQNSSNANGIPKPLTQKPLTPKVNVTFGSTYQRMYFQGATSVQKSYDYLALMIELIDIMDTSKAY